MTALPAAPGDVLAVATGPPWVRRAIRLGGLLEGKLTPVNHVILVTHQDALGRWIGIQGQPGGVGLADCTPYLSDLRTRSNHGQVTGMAANRPRFPAELATYLASCAASLGVAYDWAGIAEDTAQALHLNVLAAEINRIYAWPAAHGNMPGEMVCSALADWQYEHAGWPHPDAGRERTCTPASWWIWSDRQQWNTG